MDTGPLPTPPRRPALATLRSLSSLRRAAPVLAAVPLTAAIWFSHLPSLLTNAQFYADDGGWYQLAWAHGPILTLAHPAAGYFVLLQRLGAASSLALPLVAVPIFFNAIALTVEVAGVCYLLSSRMASAIPSLAVRVAIAALVITLPNAYDTSGNLTNAQWHLGLIAFLVVFARRPLRPVGWVVDGVIVLLSGLTGPYCILLEPVIGWRFARSSRDRWLGSLLVVNSLCALAQVLVILTHLGAQRTAVPLDAGFFPLVRMLGRQLTLGLVAGVHGLTDIVSWPIANNAILLTVLAAIPLLVCGYAAWRGPTVLRAFCYFAGAELVLALASPSIGGERWLSLGNPANVTEFHPGGIRYFLFPMLAFALSLGWLALRGWRAWSAARVTERSAPDRVGAGRHALTWIAGAAAAGVLLLTVVFGVRADWVFPPYIDQHWPAEVQSLHAAHPGTAVTLRINPRGWTVTLVAR